MRIDYNIHLDYSDVLLHPKRSTLSSRRDVDILRKFKFRNSGKELSYVPIMASNMAVSYTHLTLPTMWYV